MQTTWVRGTTIALAALGTLLVSAPAWADADAALGTGQAPTTAVAFATHGCDTDFGGGPQPDTDVWTFALPDRTRRFIALTAGFDTNGDGTPDAALSTPASGGIRDANGTSKAWIVAPAHATLVTATAVVTGTSPSGAFTLDRTCPAGPAPSASPAVSASPRASRPSPSPHRSTRVTAANRGVPAGRYGPASPIGVPSIASTPDGGENLALAAASVSPRPAAASEALSAGANFGLVMGVWAILALISCATAFFMFRRNRYKLATANGGRHQLKRE